MAKYLPSPLNETDYEDFVKYMTEDPKLLYSFADYLTISMPKPRTRYYEANIEDVRGHINEYF